MRFASISVIGPLVGQVVIAVRSTEPVTWGFLLLCVVIDVALWGLFYALRKDALAAMPPQPLRRKRWWDDA